MALSVSKDVTFFVLGPPSGLAVSKDVTFFVLGDAAAPSWPSFTFANGTVGSPYSQSFSAAGSPTITYSVVSGSLPTGLSLSGDTISGTPTVAGVFAFTLRASNPYGDVDAALSITIASGAGGAHGWTY